MSGICGYLSEELRLPITEFTQAFMLLRHRGPDDTGIVLASKGEFLEYSKQDIPNLTSTSAKSRIIFGHHRLATIDTSKAAHQPWTDKRSILLMDGEIYNYVEIRNQLKKEFGVAFTSDSDTEVVFEALKRWKEEAFTRFNGSWAIAWFNKESRELILCRDRVGLKPLYVFDDEEKLIFGSEIRYILRLLEIFRQKPSLNNRVADAYLRFGLLSHSKETFWKGVNEILPGTLSRYQLHRRQFSEKYWELPNTGDPALLDQIFPDAIEIRLRADVGQGLLLSGGLDSAMIAGEMAGRTSGQGPLGYYSAVYDRLEHGEETNIQRTEKYLSINSQKVRIDSSKVVEHLDKCLMVNEEPFGSPSVISLYQLYREIRLQGKHKVLLNGLGADEVFGGGPENGFMMLARLLFSFNFKEFLLEAGPIRAEMGLRKTISQVFHYRNFMKRQGMVDLNDYARYQILVSPLREYLKVDDRMSSVSGLVGRSPFVDHRLMESAMGMIEHERFYRGTAKYRLRHVARKKVPDMLVSRIVPGHTVPGRGSGRSGFVVPLDAWLESCLHDEVVELGQSGPHFEKITEGFWKGDSSQSDWIFRQICFRRWKKLWNA